MTPPDSHSRAMQSEQHTPKPPDFRAKARAIKLKNALENLADGKLNTAAHQLMELFRERPLTPEGMQAATALADLAAQYEAAGKSRLAIELYEKLADEQ